MVHFREIFGPQKVSWQKSTPITYFDQFFGIGTKFCMLRAHLLHFQLLGVSQAKWAGLLKLARKRFFTEIEFFSPFSSFDNF